MDTISPRFKYFMRARNDSAPENRDFVIYLHQNGSLYVCALLYFFIQGDSPFGKSDAYIKLEQLGEGSYATVYKGYSK